MKYMKSQIQYEFAGCVGFSGFADKNSNYYSLTFEKNLSIWVVDTGATSHICHDLKLFTYFTKPRQNLLVNLPDGSTQPVTHSDTIVLNPELTLYNVLYIPSFKKKGFYPSANSHRYLELL